MKVSEKFDISYVDCSSLDSFAQCPFKYMLSRCMGIEKRDKSMIALDYGRVLHECLPMCYDQSLEIVQDKFNSLWSALDYGEVDKKRNTPCAHLLLENFHNNHQVSNCAYTPLDVILGNVETTDKASFGEVPFLIDIGGCKPFAGRIDMPVRLNQTDTLWALDYKSSGEVSERFLNGFRNHPQALGYTLALSYLSGEKVSGFIVEAIRVAPLPKRPSTVPPNQWHPIYVPEHKLAWFIEWAKELSSQIEECNQKQAWPRKPTGCCPYSMFGMPGYFCKYADICDQPSDKWEEYLRFYERNEPWHPFEIAEESKEPPCLGCEDMQISKCNAGCEYFQKPSGL